MKHIILPLLLLLGFSAKLCGQQIISVKGNGKAPYTYAGEKVNMRGLGTVLESNPDAYGVYKKVKGTLVTANILAGVGGVLIGNQLGNALFKNNGQDFNTVIFGVGVAIAGTSIAIGGGASKRLSQAVELYNRDFPPVDEGARSFLSLGASGNGVGLVFNF